MNWYFEIDRKQQGPVSAEHLVSAHRSGVLADSSLVWNDSMGDWEPLSKHLPALQAETGGQDTSPTQDMAVCAYSGKVMPRADMVAYGDKWIAPEHKDAFVHGLMEGNQLDPRTSGGYEYAGFWIRVLAKIIDGLIMMVVSMVIQMPIMFLIQMGEGTDDFLILQLVPTILGQIMGFLYSTLMLWKYEATLGKMALSLKVIATDKPKLSYGQCVGRFFAEWLSSLILGIGYIMAAFDDEKRALHDHLCATRVVKK
ncbi:MAG: putative RDD family membrane protein YckC [Verrucomicrobiales bacterium]